MPALSKYNPEYHDDWAWSLAVKGATNDEIAEAFGISVRTFIRWTQKYESLKTAVETGKNIADSKVEKSLYQRAIGIGSTTGNAPTGRSVRRSHSPPAMTPRMW